RIGAKVKNNLGIISHPFHGDSDCQVLGCLVSVFIQLTRLGSHIQRELTIQVLRRLELQRQTGFAAIETVEVWKNQSGITRFRGKRGSTTVRIRIVNGSPYQNITDGQLDAF